jgi:hypothetical protein
MRTSILSAALCLTLAPLAHAQSDLEVAPEDDNLETMAPEGAATIAPSPTTKAAPTEPGAAGAPASQHTVERGDTLWDLSQKFLGSPWYWPKVWSYNPEIANPHWIYPGNQVRFLPTGEEVPTQVEVGAAETADVDEGMLMEEDDRVVVTGQLGYRPKPAINLLTPGFITADEVEGLGRIAGAFGETEQLYFPQKLYVTFDRQGAAKLGETYLVFRSGELVSHPVTRAELGVMTRVVGQVKIIAIAKNGVATAQIVRQQDPLLRGDLLAPPGEDMAREVSARPNEREVKGAIVCGSPNRALVHAAENQLVIMDKGSDDGVKEGNTFTVWRQHDALGQEVVLNPSLADARWPREDIGECVAFEVKSKTTICLVSRSIREFVSGDHAEIRVTRSRQASR